MDDPRHARLQWAKGRDVSWDGVLDGTSAANRFLLVTALTRKADLATTLSRHKRAVGETNAPAYASLPETFIIDPEESDEEEQEADRGEFEDARTDSESALRYKTVPRAVRRRGGAWALKASESNGGDDIVFFDAGDAADVVRAERFMNAHAERSCAANTPWVVQRYVESATVRGTRRLDRLDQLEAPKFKFHLRAHALVTGDARAYVHDDVVGLVARSPVRGRARLSDLRAHATNHRVRAHGGVGRRSPRGTSRDGEDAHRLETTSRRRRTRRWKTCAARFLRLFPRARTPADRAGSSSARIRSASAYAPSRRTRSRRRAAEPGALPGSCRLRAGASSSSGSISWWTARRARRGCWR